MVKWFPDSVLIAMIRTGIKFPSMQLSRWYNNTILLFMSWGSYTVQYVRTIKYQISRYVYNLRCSPLAHSRKFGLNSATIHVLWGYPIRFPHDNMSSYYWKTKWFAPSASHTQHAPNNTQDTSSLLQISRNLRSGLCCCTHSWTGIQVAWHTTRDRQRTQHIATRV